MEYVYAGLLLHSAGKDVNEKGVTGVLDAAGVKTDSTRVKALVASLKDVNIDDAIKQSVSVPVAAAPAAAPAAGGEAKKKEKAPEEEEKAEEATSEGLSALFG